MIRGRPILLITRMITDRIVTTTYPIKKNCGISKIEEFLTLEIVSTGYICPKYIFCFRKL